MLQLKLVKAEEDDDLHTKEVEVNFKKLNHGTLVVKELLKPCKHSRGPPRIICGDSYFASMQTVEEMALDKFWFIGVVKTAVKEYPINYLSCLHVTERGGHNCVISQDQEGKEDMLAALWVDRERRFLIGNAKGVKSAEPICREHWM